MTKLLIFTALTLLIFVQSCTFLKSRNKLEEAEELSRQKKYAEAMAMYREHMEDRLAIPDRPEWENPFFYLILIGDIQLGINQPEQALASYKEAEQKQVDVYLVSDRIRSVARWYEEHNRLDAAIKLLLENRPGDSLLFDAMLDRLNKLKTEQEQPQNQ